MIRTMILLLAALVPATAAMAQGWDARIARAEAREAEIVAFARDFGRDYNMIGTFARQADVANLRCSIAAEMLGLGDISGYLDFYGPNPAEPVTLPDPAAITDTAQVDRLLRYALNLGGWAYLAGQAQDQTAHQRAEFWALSCAGQHGIPAGLQPAPRDRSARFRVDGSTLFVLGDITPGFYEAFKAVVAENALTGVALGSRGGSVLDAMQAGGLIRSEGLTVTLYGDCASACPLIYVASPEPRVWFTAPFFRLGFHQISAGGEAIPLDSPIYETVGAYVAAMGVDPDFVLAAMKGTPPEGMYFPDRQLFCDAGIAAWIKGFCGRQPDQP